MKNVILGLDIGNVKVGMALSDESALVARPYQTVERSQNQALQKILSVINECQVSKIVVGLPLDSQGNDTKQSIEIKKFAMRLKKRTKIDIFYQDEAFSTSQAREHMREYKSKNSEDALAAAFILQAFLDNHNDQ